MRAEVAGTDTARKLTSGLKAAMIHASLSLVAFIPLAYLVLFRWYPVVFFQSHGGWSGVGIIFRVYVVLGPLLTLIIFSPGKPRWKVLLDISIIGTVQLSASIWGIYVVHSQRPVTVMLWEENFQSVVAVAFELLGPDTNQVLLLDDNTPPLVVARPVENRDDMSLKFLTTMNANVSLHELLDRYTSLEAQPDVVKATDLGWQQIITTEPELESATRKQVSKRSSDELLYIPFKGRCNPALLAFDAEFEFLGGVVTRDLH